MSSLIAAPRITQQLTPEQRMALISGQIAVGEGPTIGMIEKSLSELAGLATELATRTDNLRSQLIGESRQRPPSSEVTPLRAGSVNRITDIICDIRNQLGLLQQDIAQLEKVS